MRVVDFHYAMCNVCLLITLIFSLTWEVIVIPDVMLAVKDTEILLIGGGVQTSNSFMDNLPDTMKLDLYTLIFVILLVTLLFFFMKYVCFKPIMKIVDEREAAIRDGAVKLAEAIALVEQRQNDYSSSLRKLRVKAIEYRKELSIATASTKKDLLDQARRDSQKQLEGAIAELNILKESSKAELMTHVDTLSESLIQHLIRQV
jgi:F-type H+-transporting ATPase subunit b